MATRGDSRIAITLARNSHTALFNRESRFVVDDPASETPMVYQNTKPFKVGGTYNDTGVFKFVMTEGYLTEDDNVYLRAADYYKYFPKIHGGASATHGGDIPDDSDPGGKKVWL